MPKQTQGPSQQSASPNKAPARPAPIRATGTGADALIQRATADPGSLSRSEVMALQRQLGNQAVSQLLSRPTIQRAGDDERQSSTVTAPTTQAPTGQEDDDDLSGAFQQLFGEEQQTSTEQEDDEDLSGAFQRLFGEEQTSTETEDEDDLSEAFQRLFGEEQNGDEDEDDLSGAFQLLFGEESDETDTDNTGDTEPATTPTAPTVGSVTIPVLPLALTESDWDQHKGLKAKLSRDEIGVQLNLVGAMHRNVLWLNFDLNRSSPLTSTVGSAAETAATTSRTAAETARAAKATAETAGDDAKAEATQAAAKATGAARAALSATQSAAKKAASEAGRQLLDAKNEYADNVVLLLGRLQMLSNLIVAKQSKSPSAHMGVMRDAIAAYRDAVAGVQAAFAVFEAAQKYFVDLGAEAAKLNVELGGNSSDDTDLLLGGLDMDALDLDGDDTDTDTTVDEEDEDEVVAPQRVRNYLSRRFYSDLDRVKFYKSREMDDWLGGHEANESAGGLTDHPSLRRLQRQLGSAVENFSDGVGDLKSLGDQVLPRSEAISDVNSLWNAMTVALHGRNGVTVSYAEWERQQTSLAGGTSKFDAWKRKNGAIMGLYTKIGGVLKDDEPIMRGLTGQVKQASQQS